MHSDKKILVAGILAGILSIAIVAVFILPSASAQPNSTQHNKMTSADIKGSVNVREEASKFVVDNVKVSFNTAANTAQSEVEGGTVIGGQLTVRQGYLVYVFSVANYDEGTNHIVIVDAGNGKVLHTSDALPLHFGSFRFGGWHHGSWNWGGVHKGMMSQSDSNESDK